MMVFESQNGPFLSLWLNSCHGKDDFRGSIPCSKSILKDQRTKAAGLNPGDEKSYLPGLVNIQKTNGKDPPFLDGKINYFDWGIFNSKLLVYQIYGHFQ
jgi:hypothetical protein